MPEAGSGGRGRRRSALRSESRQGRAGRRSDTSGRVPRRRMRSATRRATHSTLHQGGTSSGTRTGRKSVVLGRLPRRRMRSATRRAAHSALHQGGTSSGTCATPLQERRPRRGGRLDPGGPRRLLSAGTSSGVPWGGPRCSRGPLRVGGRRGLRLGTPGPPSVRLLEAGEDAAGEAGKATLPPCSRDTPRSAPHRAGRSSRSKRRPMAAPKEAPQGAAGTRGDAKAKAAPVRQRACSHVSVAAHPVGRHAQPSRVAEAPGPVSWRAGTGTR